MTKNIRNRLGERIEIRWGVSRGRNTAGYTTCNLYYDGKRIAGCNGGGYDMRGTVMGNALTCLFSKELLRLKPEQMDEHDRWIPAEKPQRWCSNFPTCDGEIASGVESRHSAAVCPKCGKPTRVNQNEGTRTPPERYFYGLTFHDPNYDPSKAVIGKDAVDRTLTKNDEGSAGKTVAEAEQAGNSFGLERLSAIYSASSKVPTKRHRVPSIDGGCGMSCVLSIAKAIGVWFEQVVDRKNLDVYVIRAVKKPRAKKKEVARG